MAGQSIRSLILSYSVLTVAVFLYVYLPLLASRQNLDMDEAKALLSESRLQVKADMNNAHIIAVVTGATSGIGREIAAVLYSFGMTVVLASRNADKAGRIIEEIKTEYPSSKGALQTGLLDTGDLVSVAAFAADFASKHDSLHLLVLNAGIHYVSSHLTEDGLDAMTTPLPLVSPQLYDLAFATNYLGHFLLTKLLLPTLGKAGEGARVLSVSSTYHVITDGSMLRPGPDGETPEAARGDVNTHLHRELSYGNNKLAQVLHAKEAQRRVVAANNGAETVKFVSFCPGWVTTGILPENAGGRFVAALAFNSKASTIGAIGGLFSSKILGGEYVSNFHNIFTSQSWNSDGFFAFVTRHGLRTAVSHALSMVILFMQGTTYGFRVEESSPESKDLALAAALFDWSDAAVSKYAVSVL